MTVDDPDRITLLEGLIMIGYFLLIFLETRP